MSYLALARKWRPEHFDEVVGQEHVARTLKNSIEQDRVHHAYLFCGARGVGKTSTARILAKALNCQGPDGEREGPTAEPCYACQSCKDITEGQAVDVYEIDGASNRGINEIRELREGVRYAPSQSRYKIYIIDEVHMLTTEAFNALLKTLEEPPEHAYFIFATTEPQKIPITILSRCQRFDFKRIQQGDIVDHLAKICSEEGLEAEESALELIARQADGAMRDAQSVLDQVVGFAGDTITHEQVADILGVANREHLFKISRAILARDPAGALEALDTVHRFGYDMQQFASELVTHLRDLVVVSAVDDPLEVTKLTASELDEARDQLESMAVTGDERRQLVHRFFSVMADGAKEMTQSPYPKLVFEMTLVRLTQLEPLKSLDLMVDKLKALEGEFDGTEPFEPPSRDSGGGTSTPTDPAGSTTAEAETHAEQGTSREAGSQRTGEASTDTEEETDGSDEDDESDPAPEPQGPPPMEPRPGDTTPDPSPDEPTTIDVTGGTQADGGDLDLEQRWRRVIDVLCDELGSSGVQYEHAHPDRLDDGVIELGCEKQFYEFFKDDRHQELIERAAARALGGEWTVSIEPWNGDGASSETLADQREAKFKKRRADLHEAVRNHEAVAKARQLFGIDDEDVYVDVELKER
jgi:DNA polymerase-3 subunit gamma/tau